MPEDLAELTGYLRENEKPVWNATEEIQYCFQQIGKAIRDRKSSSRLAVYANELLLHLLDLFREQKVSRTKSLTDAQRSVELFLDSLQASFADEWTLESMAESCGLGVTRFVHYCKQITNQTPQQLLNQLRLEAAAGILKADPKRSVTDTSSIYEQCRLHDYAKCNVCSHFCILVYMH